MSIRATAALAAATLFMVTGCGLSGQSNDDNPETAGKIEGKVSLQTWALKDNFSEYMEAIKTGFEAEYPGTEVEWLDQPGDGYSEKVLSQASDGNLPDVVNLPPDFALPLAEQGLLLDVDEADAKLREEYVAGGVEAYEFPGQTGVYGYPWYLNTDVNYWNAELMTKYGLDPESPPTNFKELVEQAKIMKEESGGDMYLMSRKPELMDLANAGVPILSEDGSEFVFNTPEAVEVIETYQEAFEDGLMPKDVLTDKYLGNSELFTQEKVAWTTGGGNFFQGMAENNPSMSEKVVPSKALDTPPLYVQGLSISKNSDNLPTAIALARWVTSPENQAEFAELVPGIFPSTVASADDPMFSESDGTPAGDAKVIAFESLSEAKLLTPTVIDEAMGDVVKQQISQALNGDVTAKEALDAAVEKCNELLNG